MIRTVNKTARAEACLDGDDADRGTHAPGGIRGSSTGTLARSLFQSALNDWIRHRSVGGRALVSLLLVFSQAWMAPFTQPLPASGLSGCRAVPWTMLP